MDAQKMVLKLYLREDRDKQRAMKVVSDFSGIESIAMDPQETKLTVVGTFDMVAVVNKLRKICQTDILTAGPAEELEKKKEDPKKEEDKQIEEFIAYHRAYNPYLRPCYYQWG